MSYQPPPSPDRPMWPVVAACLVVVAGVVAAALFVGLSVGGSGDEPAASPGETVTPASDRHGSRDVSPAGASRTPAPAGDTGPSPTVTETVTEPPPETTSPPATEEADVCDGARTVATTRTARFAATICLTTSGTYVYHGWSDEVGSAIILDAVFDDGVGEWIAANGDTEYVVDADTGRLTVRNRGTGDVLASEPAIRFDTPY